MQSELRAIHDQLMEMTNLATKTGNAQLRDSLFEAAKQVRRARNVVDDMMNASNLIMSANRETAHA